MISNKSKTIIVIGVIMLSNLTIPHSESKIISSNKTILSNNVDSSINSNLNHLDTKASYNNAITSFSINNNSTLAFNKHSNIVAKNNFSNEDIDNDNDIVTEDDFSNVAIDNDVIIEDNSSNEAIDTDIVIEDNSSNENIDNNVTIEDNSSNTIDNNIDMEDTSNDPIDNNVTIEDNSSNETTNNNVAIEDSSSNIAIDNNIDTEDNSTNDAINNDINIAQNTITCPEINDAPVLTTSDGFNKNGIGDSVYDHLKSIGWTAVDSNTININDGRLQFKNMNGLNNIDSIITIRCDFAENDKYVLYLLKLMIGDKSISTATPSDSEIFSGSFDDKYYDNFENLVRRIANGTGTIKYSNRNIRVQYDGNWDYTITLTFSNYNDDNAQTTPSIDEDSSNIIYTEVPEI